jgi:hypothetical protein
LSAIGIVLVQPFVAGASLDTSGMICAVAWAIAIPLLAALVLVNRHETFRRRRTPSRTVAVARATAQASAFVGLVAGFWHIHWIAGVGVLGIWLISRDGHDLCSDSVGEGCLAVTQPRGRVLTDGRAAPNLEEGSPWPSCSM